MALERLRVLLQPSRTAAARALGSPAAPDLEAHFTSPDIERDWQAAAGKIETLGITRRTLTRPPASGGC